jgi:hypothetical protein
MDRFTHEIAHAMRHDDLPAGSADSVLADVRRRAARQRRRALGLAVASVAVAVVAATSVLRAIPDREPAPVEPAPGPATGLHPIDISLASATDWFVLGGTRADCEQQECLRLSVTTDGGSSFKTMTLPPAWVFSIAFQDEKTGWAWGPHELWATNDGGTRWTPVALPRNTSTIGEGRATDAGLVTWVDGDGGRRVILVAPGAESADIPGLPQIQHEGWVTPAETSSGSFVLGRFQAGEFGEEGALALYALGEPAAPLTQPCDPAGRGQLTGTPAALWIACDEAKTTSVHVSTDGAKTWTRLDTGAFGFGTQVVGIDDHQAIGVPPGSNTPSQDITDISVMSLPSTYKPAPTPPIDEPVAVDAIDGVALIAARNGLVTSSDGGWTWQYVKGFAPDQLIQPTPTATTTATVDVPQAAVPWSDRRDFAVWQAPPPEPRPTTTPCTAPGLRVRQVEGDGASGQTFLFVDVVKKTDGRCTLAAYPALSGLDDTGARVTIPTEHDQTLGDYAESPATLDRGETAQVTISSDHRHCEEAQGSAPLLTQRWTDLMVVLRDGSGLELDRDVSTTCGMSVSRFTRDNSPIEQPVRWDSLTAEVSLPERVAVGGLLTYVVTLHNRGQEDVDLAPCGGFSQQLAFQDMNGNDFAKPVSEVYRLNCDSDPTLPAGATRAYVMQLRVPDTAPAMAEARLTWQLVDTSPDHGAQGFVEVVR